MTTKTVTAYQVFDQNEVPVSGAHESRRAAWTEVAKEYPFIIEVIVRSGGIPTKIIAGNERFHLKEIGVEAFLFAYQIVDRNGVPKSGLHADPSMAWGDASKKHPSIIDFLYQSNSVPTTITAGDECFSLKKSVPKLGFKNSLRPQIVQAWRRGYNAKYPGHSLMSISRVSSKKLPCTLKRSRPAVP